MKLPIECKSFYNRNCQDRKKEQGTLREISNKREPQKCGWHVGIQTRGQCL